MCRIFFIDEKEFGESYHIGGALALNDSFKAHCILPAPKQLSFLKSITAPGTISEINKEQFSKNRKREIYTKHSEATKYIAERNDLKTIKERFISSSPEDIESISNYLLSHFDKSSRKVAIWIRSVKSNHTNRNSTHCSLKQLRKLVNELEFQAIFIGEPLGNVAELCEGGNVLLNDFYNNHPFDIDDTAIRRQLLLFWKLIQEYRLIASIGMMSGAMDGPALLGVPTLFFASEHIINKRMKYWTDTFRHYKAVHLEQNTDDCKFEKFSTADLEKIKEHLADMKC